MSKEQAVAMDFLGVEKGPARMEPSTEPTFSPSASPSPSVPVPRLKQDPPLPGATAHKTAFSSACAASEGVQTIRSDFSQTLNLFSRYFNEKGFAGSSLKASNVGSEMNVSTHLGLNSALGNKVLSSSALQTLPFRTGLPPDAPMARVPTGQLTIFYGGMVNVYEDVPADKAQAIMLLADSGNPLISNLVKPAAASVNVSQTQQSQAPTVASLNLASRAALPHQTSNGGPDNPASSMPQAVAPVPQQPIRKIQTGADLPIARKQSLQRFLEKRKDRLVSKAPYTSPAMAKSEAEDQKSGSSISLQAQSSLATVTSHPVTGRCNEASVKREASVSPVSTNLV